MEIIIQGHKVDTKDIWEICDLDRRGYAGLIVRLIDDQQIVLSEYIDNLWNFKQSDAHAKYRRLKKELIAKWEQDKSDLQVFKL